MGVEIGGTSSKSANNTHVLVIMRVRLSQKNFLHNLTNRTRLKKGNGQKQCTIYKKIFEKTKGGYIDTNATPDAKFGPIPNINTLVPKDPYPL